MKIARKSILTCLWACAATALFPVAFLYFTNIAEVSPGDGVGALLFSITTMLVLLALSLMFTRDLWKASLVAGAFFLLIMNYGMIETLVRQVFPLLRYWHLIPVSVLLLLHIVYFLCKKLSPAFFETVVMVLGLLFSVLIVLNVVMAVPTMMEKGRIKARQTGLSAQTEVDNSAVDLEKAGNYPNIYYLLFDEYSNFPVLEKYYQYDNAPLRDYLEKNGFTVSLDSHNESVSTHVVTTNNLNLDYVATSILDYAEFRDNPPLFELLDKYGYNIHFWQLEGLPIGWKDTTVGQVKASTVGGLHFWDILFQQTLLSPFFTADTGDELQAEFYEEFDFLNSTIKPQEYNSFLYIHFSFPHLPFLFNKDGGYVGMENRNNTEDNQFYLGQLIYTTTYLLKSMEKILKEDPNSVIILQSDHSNRYIGKPLGEGSLSSWDEANNILNAVYYKGEKVPEIEGLSSVNTLRVILNRVLGTEFEVLEVPTYR